MDKKTVEVYKRSFRRKRPFKRGSEGNFESGPNTPGFHPIDSSGLVSDFSLNDISHIQDREKTPQTPEPLIYNYERTPRLEDKIMNDSNFSSQSNFMQSSHLAKHASVDFGERSTNYDMFASTKGQFDSFRYTSANYLLESQNQSIIEEANVNESKVESKIDSKNVTNGFSETTSHQLRAFRKKKEIAHEALKVPTKKDEKMFSAENANSFIHKIKMCMNRKDNKVANDIMKRFTNKNNGNRCIGNLGIAPVEYTRPFPKFANLYSKAIETTVFELTANLKKELEFKNMKRMIKPSKDDLPEERPFLFELGLNMDDFVKRRGKKSIVSYIKETDDQIWGLVTKTPGRIRDYIRYSGDDDLKEIFQKLKIEEKMNQKDLMNNTQNSFSTTRGSSQNARGHKKPKTIFGYQHHDEKASSFLFNDTEKFLGRLKNQNKLARFGQESNNTSINS